MKRILKYIFDKSVFILLGIIIGWFLHIGTVNSGKLQRIESQESTTPKQSLGFEEMPYLDLPLSYFPKADQHTGYGSESEDYAGSFGGESSYRTYPTTVITLKDYDSKTHSYQKRNYNDGVSERTFEVGDKYWEDLFKASQRDHGNIVNMYWPDYLVTSADKFDVQNDGNLETILYLAVPNLNHAPHRVDIIKNGKIIFSYSGNQPEIELSKTGNGFFLNWRAGHQLEQGYCCPTGTIRTRFVFIDEVFKPIWEQETKYVNVGRKPE